jgi:hypothetical protein
MENTANIPIGYIGSVNISIPVNGKTLKINRKNKGLPELFRLLVRALAGYSIVADKPSYIDLRYLNEDGEWESCLTNRQSVSQLSYNLSDGSWIARAASTIPYSALSVTPISDIGVASFRVYLMNKNTDLAYIDVEANDVYKITPGTQALVEWILKIINTD